MYSSADPLLRDRQGFQTRGKGDRALEQMGKLRPLVPDEGSPCPLLTPRVKEASRG